MNKYKELPPRVDSKFYYYGYPAILQVSFECKDLNVMLFKAITCIRSYKYDEASLTGHLV